MRLPFLVCLCTELLKKLASALFALSYSLSHAKLWALLSRLLGHSACQAAQVVPGGVQVRTSQDSWDGRFLGVL